MSTSPGSSAPDHGPRAGGESLRANEPLAGHEPLTVEGPLTAHKPLTGHEPLTVNEHRALVDALAAPLAPLTLPLLGDDPATQPTGVGSRSSAQTGGTAEPRPDKGFPAPGRPARDCLGAVLARDMDARLAVPPFTNSAMDGFAVRFADVTPGTPLPVAGDIPAGDTSPHELVAGTAWRIMTGAPLPAGADTVVKVEHTDHAPGVRRPPASVTITELPRRGANIRQAGEDVAVGTPVLAAGTLLDATALAAAASVGYRELAVHPRPRVGIVTTGAELVGAGDELAAGQVPDSNSVLLRGLVRGAGADVAAVVRTDDDPQHLREALAGWHDVDLVLTAGGISAGAYEVVRQVLEPMGVRFHHVAQQPGGPQGVGTLGVAEGRVPVLCLPGNPVSVFVSFHVYAAGLIAVLAGRATTTAPRTVDVSAGEGWSSPPAKTQFIPLRLASDGAVHPIHRLGSGSHLVASLPLADGLGVVPAGVGRVAPDDRLQFIDTRAGTPLSARRSSEDFHE
ncbi:molybdopterin molybdotransferase MoeA [Propionibacterium freudenreichii]|uniref:Molybdopterin molybdenumtransferase n=1 Tax=Propionibacterium freudenreichii subsp. freudenreichii TaxID=66712 RepID=A0A0B7NXC3_PROFF|nr:gephyrin-like molybdotransferase Glp [Propionibacterium freudenreichii]MDN5961558.1 molybdopterin molybdotransferase MoeA [Propionibacterium sp.]CEP27596.1 Molybdenum cofactor biosynthesis protein [Propionibacterium freudenreichii subsp. freudenreichii]MDN6798418.1 molybdopterin molybdotransferase MoeA [Propionibacterium sp.]WBF59884.1 molybdopterin molybdotransferase MoeA [Propionibacterium freudenreichii]WBF62294.1 molybdopterin molybdotransferase MoeA [Propionibacterium freudenreichii]